MKGDAIDSKRAMALYDQGLTDKAIAIRMGRSQTTISGWRGRHGLPPNKNKAHAKYIPPLVQDAIDAKKLGLSYGQYKAKQYEAKQAKKKGRKKS